MRGLAREQSPRGQRPEARDQRPEDRRQRTEKNKNHKGTKDTKRTLS